MSELNDNDNFRMSQIDEKMKEDQDQDDDEDDDDDEDEDEDDEGDEYEEDGANDDGIGNGATVSIEKILEGMTNEFNKINQLCKTNSDDNNDETNKSDSQKSIEIDNNSLDNSNQLNVDSDCLIEKQILRNDVDSKKNDDKVIKSNNESLINEDTDKLLDNNVKKDSNNIPRIVLTFRTIDEKTNDGKKTKISSCASNLSLVPDELGNCDQIGGVSVKIEISDDVDKSDDENPAKNDEESNCLDDKSVPNHLDVDSQQNSSNEITENDKDVELLSKSETISEIVDKEITEDDVKLVRKRRRRRVRAFSDSNEEFPGPKRSARRLCKESNRSTVLESAMARKEKSNSTEEVKKRKKYTKPGRPKRSIKQLSPVINSNTVFSSAETANNNLKLISNNSQSEVINNCQTNSNHLNELPVNVKDKDVNIKDTSVSELNSSNDFEGMPKLQPIVKNSNFNLKSNDESISDDSIVDFVRPSAYGKSKRDRGRPKNNYGNKKVAKADSIEEGPSSASEAGNNNENNDYPEEFNAPMKRTRRSLPSPSPAEGQASKPESTAVFSQNCSDSLACLCQVQSQLYITVVGSDQELFCTAIDSIDSKIVGCCNQVDSNDVSMRRPSTRVPFLILCQSHKERLIRHNCCPSCGIFCTQGKFIQCSNGHQFHHDCQIYTNKKSSCPHCASDYSLFDVTVTMSGLKRPVLTPRQNKIFRKIPSAKMSLPGKGDNIKLAEQTVRSTSPLVQPDDIKIPEPTLSSDRPERYTIMSLYTAVKNGDLEKLVNVLACGYNANHTYKEHSQRSGLHIAADKGHLNCVHILVQAGAQLDVMDKNQLTPLMLAAMAGRIQVVQYLVRVGADVTLKGEDGMTALHMAARAGHLEACKIILSECKVPKTLVDSVDDGGWTSLIWACEFRHSDVARYLIEKKCDPLIRDSEQNIALHWSAYSGSSDITELLLSEGCDVNAVNVHGDTPLHIAARQNKYAVSVLLLARGAKISEINAAGETAINCCTNDGDTLAALKLNAKINSFSEHIWEKTIKILTNDISRGKEMNPIQCVNGFDSEDKPTDFLYVIENCFTSNINVDRTITSLQSCHCEDNCSSEKCLCGNISLRCWYDEEGKLIPEFNYNDPPMLFECNQACACNRITCNNRVVQHGLTQRFQLFRTKGKGWGLKTLRYIPKGSYVCEYVGEVISDSEADNREDDSYLFDLDNRDGETYCIDARRYGNLARFINHSCAPNLLPVRVFVEHQDLHFPRIAFFSNRDIDADEELGFDYGEKFWIIKYKSFTCTCGAPNCKYSEKTIQYTLDNYRKRIQQEEIILENTNKL